MRRAGATVGAHPETPVKLHRHALSALVVFVGVPLLAPLVGAGTAEGAIIIGNKTRKEANGKHYYPMTVVVGDGSADGVDSVELDVRSDAGSETLTLTESDAWLHGAAALSGLPSEKATLSLTLYDTGSGTLISFSGARLGGGSITFTENAVFTCDTSSKIECSSQKPTPDVEVLAAELYPAEKGYELALDLAGADTYAVAYAEIVVTEPWEVTDECLEDKSGPLCGDTGHFRVEMDWDGVGSVWEADATLEHTGMIDVKAKTLDANGETIENVRASLGEPWFDDGAGVNTLATDGDPLTTVALTQHFLNDQFSGGHVRTPRMTIVSEGWTTTSYPTHAELEVSGGTVTIPANSYQRLRKRPEILYQAWENEIEDYLSDLVLDPGSTISITSGNFLLEGLRASELSTPVCSSGTCVVLVESERGYALSVTTYGEDAAKLPAKQDLAVVFYDKSGGKLASETISVEFDEEIVAVFANDVEFVGDPTGLDASGGVSLLGAADRKAEQQTLAKGTFHGSFSVDGDGDLGLGGYGTDDAAKADTTFAVLLGGAVECGGGEYACDSGDWAPPMVAYRLAAYVVGIRRVASPIKLKGAY